MLPEGVRPEDITAHYANGVLDIVLPHAVAGEPVRIPVQAGRADGTPRNWPSGAKPEVTMTQNMGPVDRMARVVMAALTVWLATVLGVASVGGIILLVVAAVLAGTAAVGFCPLYLLARISTRRLLAPH